MKQLFTISGRYAATEDASITPQVSGLSWNTRLQGFAICLIASILLGVGAAIAYFLGGNLSGFAVLYTLANLAAIGSTFFLTGPMNQLKKMFDASRFIATIVFLLCVVLTLISALVWKISILVLLFIILQFFALIWYTLSYIPFARDAIKTCCRGCFNYFRNLSDDDLMSISGSHRTSLVVIPFLQKRLRRITSIGLHNLTVNERHFTLFFTLQRFHQNAVFFTSESVENERNPEWSNLQIPVDAQCLREFRISFWLKFCEKSRLFLQYEVYLDNSLVPDVQKNFISFGSNCFWFEMFGHRFSDVETVDANSSSVVVSSRLNLVKSYNRSSVLRIFNLIETIRNEENLAAKCLRDVENLFKKKNEILSQIVERETRQIRIKNLQKILTSRTSKNHQRTILLGEKEKILAERRTFLEFYRSRLILQRESIDELLNFVEQSRSDLFQLQRMIEQRRKDLLKDISNFIYPIELNSENQWTIVRAKLLPANDKIFLNSSIRDKEIAGALVFSSHLILLISNILDLPLRYPIEYFADGTVRIYDFTLEIPQSLLIDPPVDLNAFRYAFYLLNRDIGQILFHCRIPTRRVDFRRTLENLKTFFEQFVQI